MMRAKAEAKLGPNWQRPEACMKPQRDRLLSITWKCEETRDAALAVHLYALMRRYPSLKGDPLFQAVS